jgi:penicillin-binding protein 1A
MTELSSMKKAKYLAALWLAFIIPIAVLFLVFWLIARGAFGFMPTFEELENPDSNLATEIYSSDSVILGTYFRENRAKADFHELSPYLVDALIATEDARYYSHSGIDVKGLGRVAFKTILAGDKGAGGGSTISQQLAKMLFPRERFDNVFSIVNRKLREWVIAVKLEKSYTKEEIIAMYFNQFDFLNHAVGIKSAARVYFSTTPMELKIEEAAMLVGMAKNPALFNPLRRYDTTMHRRNVVLSQMVRYDMLTNAEFDSLKIIPIELKYQKVDHKLGSAPYFREFLRVMLTARQPIRENYRNYNSFLEDSTRWADEPWYGWCNKNKKADGAAYDIYRDGIKIYTTLNSKMQLFAENAVKNHLSKNLQPVFDSEQRGRRKAPYSDDLTNEQINNILTHSMRISDRYRAMRHNDITHDSIVKAFKKPRQMELFSYKGLIDTVISPWDSIRYMKRFLHAGMLSFEPSTGHVKAFVGGIDYRYFQYDHVLMQKRQVGSTFKPFLYTLAMQEGMSPCHKLPNVPTTFYMADTTWTPGNSDDAKLGEMVTLEWGLAVSNNFISARLMQMFKPEPIINIAREMGVRSYIPPVPSICLGVPELSLYEMVGAYGTYANKGVYTQPIFISRIEDKYGNIIASFVPRRNEAISEETAFLMIKLMENVVNRGTSIRLRYTYQLDNHIAGKTGTTNDHSDGWFMGMTPELVTGVWVGGVERGIRFRSIREGQGANMALPIWAMYMNDIYADTLALGYHKYIKFEKPDHVPFWKVDCREFDIRSGSKVELQQVSEEDKYFD